MTISVRLVFLVFMVVSIHTLPQDPKSSNELTGNDGGFLDESNTFTEADPVVDQTSPIFNQEKPDVLYSDDPDAFDLAHADVPDPENSDIIDLSKSPESSGPNPRLAGEPPELPPSPAPPYYCEDGRKPACCGKVYLYCDWWHKFKAICQNPRQWTCCLKIDFLYPNWGVDCTVGYIPFETYTPNGNEVPAGRTAAPTTSPVPVPERAPDAKYLPFPEYESPSNICPIRGDEELDKCDKSQKPSR